MKKVRNRLALLMALAFVSLTANATSVTLYDHTDDGDATNSVALPPGFAASSFTTGAFCPSGCVLGDVTLSMFITDATDESQVILELYTDAGTTFGDLITTLSNPAEIGTTIENVVFKSQGQVDLAADTIYWLRLSADPDADDVEWGLNFGGGGSGNFHFDNGTALNGIDSPFMFKVEAEALAVSDVPVPGAVWLMGTALAGLGIRRRRNLKK